MVACCSFNVLLGFSFFFCNLRNHPQTPSRLGEELSQISAGSFLESWHQDAHPLQRQQTRKELKESSLFPVYPRSFFSVLVSSGALRAVEPSHEICCFPLVSFGGQNLYRSPMKMQKTGKRL